MDKKDDTKQKGKNRIAVVRIRGKVKLRKDIKDTLDMLKLYKQNYCIIIEPNPSNMGMIKKAENYITWGEIDDDTLAMLKEKREEITMNKQGKKIAKSFFRLNPPRKGFGRKGIKMPFNSGGALGYRGDKINDLIRRMI